MDSQLQSQPFQQPVVPPPPVPSSGIPKILLIILAFFVLAATATAAYILGTKQNQSQQIQRQPTVTVPTPTPNLYREPTSSAATANWKTYTEPSNIFSIKYPSDWIKSDHFLYPFGVPNANEPYNARPVIVLGAGGRGEALPKETRTYPGGTAQFEWSTTQYGAGGVASFQYKKGYIIIQADNIPLNKEGYVKNIFNQILSTFKFTDQNQSTNQSTNIDLASCTVGKQYNKSLPLGSKSAKITAKSDNQCVIEYTDEIEGGYTRYECKFPKNLRTVDLLQIDVEKFCIVQKSGNVFLENK